MKTALLALALAITGTASADDLIILHPGSYEGAHGTFDSLAGTTLAMTASGYDAGPYDTLHRDGFDDEYAKWDVTINGVEQVLHCSSLYVPTSPGNPQAQPWLFLDCTE